MNKNSHLIYFSYFLLFTILIGCGKKGSPFLVKEDFTSKVSQLEVAWENGMVLLKGRITDSGGRDDVPMEIEGCRVYYGQYSLQDPPCPTCPIRFHAYHGFGTEVIQKKSFLCRVPGKMKGQIYYFRVHLIGPKGAIGPPSERVKLVVN